MSFAMVFRIVRGTISMLVLAGVLCLLLARAGTARAAGTVGTGTPGSCTDAAFSAALSGGGPVSFNCSLAPVTITVGSTKDIVADTQIDGGGKVTLSGADAVRVLKVEAGATLELKNMTVSNGLASNDYGGAIRSGGVLIIDNCRIVNSQATGPVSGGGIRSEGTLTVSNSVISGNASAQAAASALAARRPSSTARSGAIAPTIRAAAFSSPSAAT